MSIKHIWPRHSGGAGAKKMAKVIQQVSYAPQGSGWLSGLRGLLTRLSTGPRRPGRLNPEEWSGHMLKDVGLPESLAEGLPSRTQMIWMR
jgi:hypothetical protein